MKKRLLAASIAAATLAAASAFAQAPARPPAAPPPERGSAAAIDAVRQAARDDRRGVVERNLQLTPDEAKKFWPVYDGYSKELDAIVKRQNRAVLDYVNAESSLTDANANRLAGELLATDTEEVKLRAATYKRVRAVLPVKKAVRFLQIENKLRTLARYDTAAQVPLVK
jgi:Spy/CpxP family protein refolding chaperone